MIVADDEMMLHIEDEQENVNELAMKVLAHQDVEVIAPHSGVIFTIRYHDNAYGLPAYDIVVAGKVERKGVILERATVEDWCTGLIEVTE